LLRSSELVFGGALASFWLLLSRRAWSSQRSNVLKCGVNNVSNLSEDKKEDKEREKKRGG